MSLRLFVESPLSAALELTLPEDAARHVQVRRLQPGDGLCLFDGRGGEWRARVTRMGKRDVDVRVDVHDAVTRELPFELEIALGMPTNERMDALIEKATELGVAAIQPLQTERSVLRLDGERAARRVAHWQAVAVGASEQSGRTRVPVVAPVRSLGTWLAAQPEPAPHAGRFVMSTGSAPPLAQAVMAAPRGRWLALSGPEGGLTADEEAAAHARGFTCISLGKLILRADTAPLAWLAQMAVLLGDEASLSSCAKSQDPRAPGGVLAGVDPATARRMTGL
jgi:16S rRNA (uracil1498-N3)-methyltransferase